MNRARVSFLGQAVSLTIGLAVGLGFVVRAGAQWLPDRRYSEGPGIQLGELELHPGIAVRGGYDNNVFRSDGKTRMGPNGPIKRELVGSAILAISPHIFMSTEGSQRASQGEDQLSRTPRMVQIPRRRIGTYFHYFVDNGPRNLAVDTSFFLAVAQGRPVGMETNLDYRRSVTPFTENVGSRNGYLLDRFDPSLRLTFSSRAKVLSGHVGYSPRYVHYKDSAFSYLNSIQHGVDAGAAWRFLPSTALLYDARLGLQNYLDESDPTEQPMVFSDNQSFHTRLGLNGALSTHVTLRVLAGYAAGFYDNRHLDDFEDAVGEVVLGYGFGTHSLEVGYQRDVQTSALGAWYQTDRGYAKIGFMFARVFSLTLEGGAAHANYGRLVRLDSDGDVEAIGLNNDSSRDDIRADGAVRTEYRVTNWLSFMADFSIQSIITDFEYGRASAFDPDTGTQRFIPDPAGYTAMQVFGGVRAHY